MTRRITTPNGSRDASILACVILVALALTLACASAAAAAPAGSLRPTWRTIILRGDAMPQIVGSAESHLEVLALHGASLAPIPFQVDEVLSNGRYTLPDGPEPLADDSPGIFDRDDEIAMMLSDFGDQVSSPPRGLPLSVLEIETVDESGARRYAYIAAVPSPRLSPVRYVSYDPIHSRIEGGSYRMTFRGDFPVGLALKDRRGNLSPSLIKGSQVQVTGRVLMLFKLQLNGSGVTNHVLAWHAGPIRLIRQVSHSVKLIFGIKTPRVLSEEIFYRNYAEDSFVARVLWVPRMFFGDVRVRTWLDFDRLNGFTLAWSGMQGRPLESGTQGAAGAAAEISRDPPEVKWLALKGDGKIVMQTFKPSPDLATLRRRLYYCDGTAAPDTTLQISSDCTGAALQIGYLVSGWENLSAGAHRINSVLMILPYSANPDAVARELTTTPSVSVRPARR